MRRRLPVALALVLVVLGPSALAQTPRGVRTTEAGRIEALTQRLTNAVSAHRAVGEDAVGLVLKALEIADEALELGEKNMEIREVEGWVKARLEPLERERAALVAAAAAAPPINPDLIAALDADPTMTDAVVFLRTTPSRFGSYVGHASDFVLQISNLARPTANGEPRASRRMQIRKLEGAAVLLEIENAELRLQLASTSPETPEHPFTQSVLNSNLAVMAMVEAMRAEADGRTVDARLVASDLKNRARLVSDSSKRMVTLGQAVIADFSETPLLTPLERSIRDVAELYVRAGVVEEDAARLIDRAATGLERGGGPDMLRPIIESLELLSERRADLQKARISTLVRRPI